MAVFITSAGHHFQITLLSQKLLQKQHVYIYCPKIILQNTYLQSLIHQVPGIFFDKGCFSRSQKARN